MRAAWGILGVTLGIIAATLVIAVVVAAVTVTQIRGSQVDNTRTINNTDATLENTKQTLEVLLDCTRPEGKCYQRGQDNTAEVVDNIGLLSAYAAACADEPEQQTADEIRDCVLELVNRSRAKR